MLDGGWTTHYPMIVSSSKHTSSDPSSQPYLSVDQLSHPAVIEVIDPPDSRACIALSLCEGCKTISRSGTVRPTEERRCGSVLDQHESPRRARSEQQQRHQQQQRQRRWWWRRWGQWRGGDHPHPQLPHHLLPLRPGEPAQQVLPVRHILSKWLKSQLKNDS